MNKLNITIAAAVAACSCGAFAAIRAVTPAEKGVERHALKMKAITNDPPKVVFLGDSITHFWEVPGRGKGVWDKFFAEGPQKALCLGTSGDRTENVLWRIENGELDGYTAKTFTLMIGTNASSLPGMPPNHIARATKKIIDLVFEKHPEAERLILHPIFPRGASADDKARQKNEAVNKLIKEFADGKKVVWCDFNAKLVDEKGDTKFIMPDRLHPNDAGHEIWWNEIKGMIGE